MSSQTLVQLCLVLHITGFTIMGGSVLADFVLQWKLSKYLLTDPQRSLGVLEAAAGLTVLISVGAILLVVTGIGMVYVFREAVTSMAWFRIKMGLVLLIIFNGARMARPGIGKLRILLGQNMGGGMPGDERGGMSGGKGGDPGGAEGRIIAIRNRLRIIYVLQMIFILAIFVLSVLRF